MKSVIKAIVFFIMGLTVIFYGGAYMLPGEARVERTAVIAAPPDRVYAIAADLRRWPEWSAWPAIDPKLTFTFEGPEQGAGQAMHWVSANPMVGSGTMRITAAAPSRRLATSTDYAGFGASTATMEFAPEGSGTRVTWAFRSALPGVIDRWAGLGMDGSVGAEYERALSRLKALAEAAGG